MGLHNITAILRMELYTNKPWMIAQFHDLNEITIGIDARSNKSFLFKFLLIIVIKFIPVPVAFHNKCLAISIMYFGTLLNFTGCGLYHALSSVHVEGPHTALSMWAG